MVIAAAIVSFGLVILFSRALARFGPRRIVPLGFLLSAAGHLVEWRASGALPGPVAVATYLHIAGFGALLLSGFWSLVNEAVDPHTAKHNFARITGAGTAGGIAGGLLAGHLAAGESVPFAVRRRIPRILARAGSQRALDALLLGLEDERFEVRFQCSRALDWRRQNHPALELSTVRILAVVERELSVARPIWEGRRLLDEREDGDGLGFLDEAVRGTHSQSLDHVFRSSQRCCRASRCGPPSAR
jgi:hypothetical protein